MKNLDGMRMRLITDPRDREKTTFVRQCDCRTAVARGLKEYIEDLSIDWTNGKHLAFTEVLEVWGDEVNPADMKQSCVVNGVGEGTYLDTQLSPTLQRCEDGTNRVVKIVGEFEQEFDVLIWSDTPTNRVALVSMVEDALDPVDWMCGMRLELPFFFGARATYDSANVVYIDTADDAQKRYRVASIHVTASVAHIIPVGPRPNLIVQTQTLVDGRS